MAHRRGRQDDDGRGAVRRARSLRGARSAGRRDLERDGLLEKIEHAPARRRPLRALRHGGRADGLAAVVREDRRRSPPTAIARGATTGASGSFPSAGRTTYYDWMDEHPRLVHLAPALVGAPHPGLVLRRLRRDDRGERDADRVPQCGRTCSRRTTDVLDTWFSRGCGRSARSAGPTTRTTCGATTRPIVLVTGFDIIFFWVARMIMLGLRFTGDVPFRDVYMHGAGARRARPEDEQVEGQRRRSARDHRRVRRRRAAVHAGGDGVARQRHRAVGGRLSRLPPVR